MKFLARLMSHGFAIALVLLLAIGFIYRGELFPEWELPEFLAFDSAKDTGAGQPAGKIEPAPVQLDGMRAATARGGKDTPTVRTGDVSTTVPPVDRVTVADASVPALSGPAIADATAGSEDDEAEEAEVAEVAVESEPAVPEAVAMSEPAGADEAAMSELAGADAIATRESAVLDGAESAEEADTGAAASGTGDAAMLPAAESPSAAISAAMETATAPAAATLQAPVESAATTARDAATALAKAADAGHAAVSAETAIDATAGMDSATATPDVGTSPEPPDAGLVTAYPHGTEEIEAATAGHAADMAARTAIAPVAADTGAVAAATGGGTAPATVATETGAPDSGPTHVPVASADDAYVIDAIPAQAEVEMQTPEPAMPVDATLSAYQLLALAREAYWMRDYPVAGDYYRQMILQDPNNPDGYGELANMYFSQGDWEAAASAYYEAGLRLVESGLLAPARGLVDVIRGLNGPQADALEHEIEMAQSDSQ